MRFAGGLTSLASGQRAILERVDQRSVLQSENIRLDDQGLSTSLRDGDLVRLLSFVPRFDKVVSLRGNVADPVRLPWRAGMRISDLIPNKEALLTRDFWKQREQLSGGSQEHRDIRQNEDANRSLAAVADDQSEIVRKFVQKNDVQPPAADINWKYATVERLEPGQLTTTLIAFDLGKAVNERDPESNLELRPGDIVSVFSNADFATAKSQQTVYVRIEGEVTRAGTYSVHPGENLRDLVTRAGGLTPSAYLYGSQLTRISVKKEQQARYTEFIEQVNRDVTQSSTSMPVNASAETVAAMQASVAAQQKLVERLRNAAPTGRIVLDLPADSNSLDRIPNVPLENGDRFYVPASPSTVNVVGTVYNQAAFLFQPELRVGDYLNEAGGPTRYADNSRAFVIRADGSVTARDARTKQYKGRFESLPIHPGDTLVIPTTVMKSSVIRNLRDWSQVISGFGLGAAAVSVLR